MSTTSAALLNPPPPGSVKALAAVVAPTAMAAVAAMKSVRISDLLGLPRSSKRRAVEIVRYPVFATPSSSLIRGAQRGPGLRKRRASLQTGANHCSKKSQNAL
jgi:hypothetical protein